MDHWLENRQIIASLLDAADKKIKGLSDIPTTTTGTTDSYEEYWARRTPVIAQVIIDIRKILDGMQKQLEWVKESQNGPAILAAMEYHLEEMQNNCMQAVKNHSSKFERMILDEKFTEYSKLYHKQLLKYSEYDRKYKKWREQGLTDDEIRKRLQNAVWTFGKDGLTILP